MRTRSLLTTGVLILVTGLGVANAASIIVTDSSCATRADAIVPDQIEGKIASYDAKRGTFMLIVNDEKLVFSLGKTVMFTLNGEESTADGALRAGFDATVTYEEGVASAVDARSEK